MDVPISAFVGGDVNDSRMDRASKGRSCVNWRHAGAVAVAISIVFYFGLRAGGAPEKGKPEQGGDYFTIAQLRYGGGGDWYEDRTSVVRLQERLQSEFGVAAGKERKIVKLTDETLFSYPMLYMCGHGNVLFSEAEANRLRAYLERGGFLWVSDDYGMDSALRREMKKVFPEQDFVELPFSNSIYHQPYEFPRGLPKIHEHAGGPPRGYALFVKDRIAVFYDFNTDIGDGLEAPGIHEDPTDKREQAFKMAVNIAFYALSH